MCNSRGIIESQGGASQTYATLSGKLKEHFENALTRENAMKTFERAEQKIDESEEEFMMTLLSLYKLANPNHTPEITLAAIKRKFMNGISDDLRRNIFVFCNDPYNANVTREQLLGFANNARMHMGNTTATDWLTAAGTNSLTDAINNLTLQLQIHVKNTERRLDGFDSISVGLHFSNEHSW